MRKTGLFTPVGANRIFIERPDYWVNFRRSIDSAGRRKPDAAEG
jgi:hypothetical protein